jgi:outer membrane protein assembly factor BamB
VYGGIKMRNNQYGMITQFGTFVRLDAAGKEQKSITISQNMGLAAVDALPSGRIVVPIWGESKVVEFDADGKRVWEASANTPASAMRLPNGNTLVACNGSQEIIELDRNGKKVWEHKATGNPWRARRR